MKAGARNQITGEVLEVKNGSIMSLVNVRIPTESIISSVMTNESADDLEIKPGDKVKVVIKAVNVLVVKE